MNEIADTARPAAAPVHPALPRAVPFLLYVGFIALGPLLAPMLPDPRWLYAAKVSTVLLALLAFRRSYGELWRPERPLRLSDAIIAGAVGVAMFLAWIRLDVRFLSIGQSVGFDPRQASGSIDWGLAGVRLFGAAIVVPLMEELFWRSLVMRWLERHDFLTVAPSAVGARALVFGSVVFGVEHNLWFAGFLAGLAYGALYRRSGNLWVPIIAHFVTNLALGAWILHTAQWQFW